MSRVIFIIAAYFLILIAGLLSYLYLTRRKESGTLSRYLKITYSKKHLLLCIAISLVAVLIFSWSYYHSSSGIIKSVAVSGVFVWLAVIALIDYKEQIIPNVLILSGLSFWVVYFALELLAGNSSFRNLIFFSISGGLVWGGIMFLIALIAKTALGMGDAKMILVLGLFFGFSNTYSVLLTSIIIMAVVSIVLLIMKKANRKTAIPMAPFVLIGFLINSLLVL